MANLDIFLYFCKVKTPVRVAVCRNVTYNPMKVLKFGGTSVGTVESLANVKSIVDSLDEPAVVVVSALGGLTDRLIATAKAAADGDASFRESMRQMAQRHQDIIDSVVPAERRTDVRREVSEYLSRLEDIYTGLSLIGMLPEKVLNRIVSFGERMSSIIVAAMLRDGAHMDPLDFMKTEKWFGKDIAARELTDKLIREKFCLPLARTVVTGGFISRDRNTGEITNLGRGGSDYTAALIAAALDADLLEIWTDVNGFMTADPRIIPDALVIDRMSFIESMELCSYGAKVVYPPTIYPVFHKNIPIKILNTFNPGAPGTLITDAADKPEGTVRGVTSVRTANMIGVQAKPGTDLAGLHTRACNAMSKNGINVLLSIPADDSGCISVMVQQSDAAKARRVLTEEFAPELSNGTVSEIIPTENLSVVAVVRESIKELTGLGARLASLLRDGGIDLKAVSDGVSATTIAFVTDVTDTDAALRIIHTECYPRK